PPHAAISSLSLHDALPIWDFGEHGIGGQTVQLLDLSGVVVATTTTRADGSYRFDGLDLGTYRVRVVLRAGATLTTPLPDDISITRGMSVNGVNFGESA